MKITDRAKDVIKSGGEWISSIAIEEAAASHAHVEACAVIGIAHEKWGKRPLLFIKARPSARLSEDAMRTHLSARLDRWCMPDVIDFVAGLPLGATGRSDARRGGKESVSTCSSRWWALPS